jgi:hypothetical protein
MEKWDGVLRGSGDDTARLHPRPGGGEMNYLRISLLGGDEITANGKKCYSFVSLKIWRFQFIFFFEAEL